MWAPFLDLIVMLDQLFTLGNSDRQFAVRDHASLDNLSVMIYFATPIIVGSSDDRYEPSSSFDSKGISVTVSINHILATLFNDKINPKFNGKFRVVASIEQQTVFYGMNERRLQYVGLHLLFLRLLDEHGNSMPPTAENVAFGVRTTIEAMLPSLLNSGGSQHWMTAFKELLMRNSLCALRNEAPDERGAPPTPPAQLGWSRGSRWFHVYAFTSYEWVLQMLFGNATIKAEQGRQICRLWKTLHDGSILLDADYFVALYSLSERQVGRGRLRFYSQIARVLTRRNENGAKEALKHVVSLLMVTAISGDLPTDRARQSIGGALEICAPVRRQYSTNVWSRIQALFHTKGESMPINEIVSQERKKRKRLD